MLLVIGPTCAGKSTYIHRLRDEARARGEELTVHFAHQLRRGEPVPTGPLDVVHVNLLRGRDESRIRRIAPVEGKELSELIPAADDVVVIAAPRSALLARATARTRHEPHQNPDAATTYDAERWTGALTSPHLAQRLEQLALALDGAGTPVTFLCSNHAEELKTVSRWQFPLLVAEGGEALCAAGHPVPELDLGSRTYQKDYREGAGGSPRSRTLARALQMPLDGRTLLDVGCAEGAAALAAARMGATVTGLEPKPARMRKANRIADALGTPITLHNTLLDNFDAPRDSFDVVLALNVVHHVRDPFAFLDRAASLSRSHLVLEYPGLTDRKFKATLDGAPPTSDDLPLIGVSLPDAQDQTFVFTPSSLQRYLVDILGAFSSHEVVESPIPNRWLSVFSQKSRGGGLNSALSREAALRRRVARLEGRLQAMETSRSWRLTGPLRKVAGLRS